MGRGRPLCVDWVESEKELHQLYLSEKDRIAKQRTQFLWLVRGGKTIRESSYLAGLQERTGRRYISWYRIGGIKEVLARRQGGDNGNQQRRLNEEQQAQLRTAANEGKLKTVWEGIEWVKAAFGVHYSYEGMRSVYKRLNLKKKVPRKQHIKSDPKAQAEWKKGAWLTD